jgi:tetratricopeptide (TPR) repeat protein
MPYSRPEELNLAEELIRDNKREQALEIITNFERKKRLAPEEKVSVLLLKGRLVGLGEVAEFGKRAYKMSLNLGMISETIESLILQSSILWGGQFDEALDLLLKAEKLLNSHSNESQSKLLKLKNMILTNKSWGYWFKNRINDALDLSSQRQPILEKLGDNSSLANNSLLRSYLYLSKSDYDAALDYAKKSLILCRQLNDQWGISGSLNSLGYIHYYKGNLNIALEYAQKSLNNNELDNRLRIEALEVLGLVYREKGEISQALEYFNQVVSLADKLDIIDKLAFSLQNTGITYMMKGESDKAIENLKRSVTFLSTIGYNALIPSSLFQLVVVHLNTNSYNQAKRYLKDLKDCVDRFDIEEEEKIFYLLGKAVILKSSKRIHDHAEAERLLKQVMESDTSHQLKTFSMVSLCEILLEELSIYNNPEVLEEINILIKQLLKVAENQHSFSRLAEVKLLQAKLALIQIDIEEAKGLLKDAQNIAESHDLKRLSIKISTEHDVLLERINEWENLRKIDAPMTDRIKLASFDGVINRLQGKRAIDPPELVNEQPTLLLIIAEGGTLLFSYSFGEKFPHEEDLISGFLTAFSSFSEELFSKGLDRAKFGEDTILLDSVGSFSVCYLFKGQTYPAMQKLNHFKEEITNSTPIMQTLENYYQTSQVLEIKDSPMLEDFITEIFMSNSPQKIVTY